MRIMARYRYCWLLLLLSGWSAHPLLIREARADAFDAEAQLNRYVSVPLEVDLAGLSEGERRMIPLLTDAARAMESVFWRQTMGDPEALFAMPWTQPVRQLLAIHFGPWDRMENNRPLVPGIAAKPEGARFYPETLTREAFEEASLKRPELKDPFALVRNDPEGGLMAVPYHEAFSTFHALAADRLKRASTFTEDAALARYLRLRAEALLTDRYQ